MIFYVVKKWIKYLFIFLFFVVFFWHLSFDREKGPLWIDYLFRAILVLLAGIELLVNVMKKVPLYFEQFLFALFLTFSITMNEIHSFILPAYRMKGPHYVFDIFLSCLMLVVFVFTVGVGLSKRRVSS